MKYGMNLLLWTDDATGEECRPLLEQIKEIGYDGVEIPIFSKDVERFARLGKLLDELGLDRTAVTVRGSGDDPMSADPAIRDAGIEANKTALDCCQALGARVLCGPLHSALGDFSGAPPTDDEVKRAADAMRMVAEHAKKTRCYTSNGIPQPV